MFLRLLLLILISCNNNSTTTVPPAEVIPANPTEVVVENPATPIEVEAPHEASTPIGPSYPVANVEKIFTVKIEDTNYTPAQKAKLARSITLLTKIFNSPEYKQAVLAHKPFGSNKGLSNLAIFEKLFQGAEALIPAVDYEMDLKVTMYYKKYSKVVGYTDASSMIVNTNSKFHNYYTPCEIASNLTHEWTHKMGFGHLSASDYNSVPYSHNEIVKSLCSKFGE